MVMTLASKEFLRLTRARGTTVEVLDGRVWITEAGQAGDAFISPGMRYRVAGNGLVVIGMDAAPGAGATRVALWPPVWRWLRERIAVVARRLADGALERRTISELEALPDRMLRDIGLSRADIRGLFRP